MIKYTTSTSHPAPLRIAPVVPLAVHDADSLHVRLPLAALWPAVMQCEEYCRVAHCNAAELSTPLGQDAKLKVMAWLVDPLRGEFTVHAWGRENYGRWLIDLQDASGAFLSDYVLTLAGSVRMSVYEQKGT